jgi:hypothetical protein
MQRHTENEFDAGHPEMRLAGGDPSLDFVNTIDARFAGPDLLLTHLDLLISGERVSLLERGEVSKTPRRHRG